jgi:hypothetical protein
MELDNATKAIYVLDSVKAARLVDAVQNTEIYALANSQERANKRALKEFEDIVRVFRSRKRPSGRPTSQDSKAIVFEPGSEVFVCTHQPGHYFSTGVATSVH